MARAVGGASDTTSATAEDGRDTTVVSSTPVDPNACAPQASQVPGESPSAHPQQQSRENTVKPRQQDDEARRTTVGLKRKHLHLQVVALGDVVEKLHATLVLCFERFALACFQVHRRQCRRGAAGLVPHAALVGAVSRFDEARQKVCVGAKAAAAGTPWCYDNKGGGEGEGGERKTRMHTIGGEEEKKRQSDETAGQRTRTQQHQRHPSTTAATSIDRSYRVASASCCGSLSSPNKSAMILSASCAACPAHTPRRTLHYTTLHAPPPSPQLLTLLFKEKSTHAP